MFKSRKPPNEVDLETLKRVSKILIIDDQEFPLIDVFIRNGYNVERIPDVRNLTELTDDKYQIILLDIQGVGQTESHGLQGLGILKAIKDENPSKCVILYSSSPINLTDHPLSTRADFVLEKHVDYIEYQRVINLLLKKQGTTGYYIELINNILGPDVMKVPKIVIRADQAMRQGKISKFKKYLQESEIDGDTIKLILHIIVQASSLLNK